MLRNACSGEVGICPPSVSYLQTSLGRQTLEFCPYIPGKCSMDYIVSNAYFLRVPSWHLRGVVAWTAASWMGLVSQGLDLHPQNEYQAPEGLNSCSVT